MRDMNLWTIIGNLTKDPLLNHLDDGTAVCHFRVGVHSRRGEDSTTFVDVTAWRREAEHCAKYLRKGSRLCVAGPLHATLVTLKDGRPILDLAVDAKYLEFMGGPKPKTEAPDAPSAPPAAVPAAAPARRPPTRGVAPAAARR